MKNEIIKLCKEFLKFKKIEKPKENDYYNSYEVNISLKEIEMFSKELFNNIINDPEETIYTLNQVIRENFKIEDIEIRFIEWGNLKKIKIRDLRARNLNKLILFDGYAIAISDVRPQVVSAKFECPKCGTIIEVLQIEKRFREPSRCTCGRKSQFRLITKKMVDAQRIVLAEEKGEYENNSSQRISVFLKEGLTDPKRESLYIPGKKAEVLGILNEVPLRLDDGEISTRFDLAIETNNIMFNKKSTNVSGKSN
jgi:DNA replicative helicase MCM subunit Mcm2 (Cdc46/Mcm family)